MPGRHWILKRTIVSFNSRHTAPHALHRTRQSDDKLVILAPRPIQALVSGCALNPFGLHEAPILATALLASFPAQHGFRG
jgi:hypothetical protein